MGNRGGPGPFFQGSGPWGATILPLHDCIYNLTRLPSKLKPRTELKFRDIFFKILFVGWGNYKRNQDFQLEGLKFTKSYPTAETDPEYFGGRM